MNNIVVINNIHGYSDEKGIAWLEVRDLAVGLGLGFKQIKNGKEYDGIRWNRMKKYLIAVGYDFLQHHAKNSDWKDAYIPENIVYKLLMKVNNEVAKPFQDMVCDEILPQIGKTGSYIATPNFSNPAEAARAWADQYEKKQLAEAKAKELEAELDESKEWYTVKRVAKNNGIKWETISWRDLKKASIAMGVRKIFDANYGNVNAYHITAWRAVYPSFKYN